MTVPVLRPSGRRCEILHITENGAEHRLLVEVMGEHPHIALHRAATGEAAINVLTQAENSRFLPNVILLSWVLPNMSGEDLLRHMKTHAQLKAVPVIVFTSIDAPQEIRRIYELGANCVLLKAWDLEELTFKMRLFASFWGSVARLPSCGSD